MSTKSAMAMDWNWNWNWNSNNLQIVMELFLGVMIIIGEKTAPPNQGSLFRSLCKFDYLEDVIMIGEDSNSLIRHVGLIPKPRS